MPHTSVDGSEKQRLKFAAASLATTLAWTEVPARVVQPVSYCFHYCSIPALLFCFKNISDKLLVIMFILIFKKSWMIRPI